MQSAQEKEEIAELHRLDVPPCLKKFVENQLKWHEHLIGINEALLGEKNSCEISKKKRSKISAK